VSYMKVINTILSFQDTRITLQAKNACLMR
jgi:hypothetical protein